ncbi:hypothetical protein [Photobacterium atrarenae]|uniref:Uncharacterized protein n=1 Tax=Photobacterium atrarenae TaxID=865757 RepID=A0ABY5GBL9_9GAMM|nr:hypothetical protein [Photobacterium atrarenae]UTV26586.1 hypothetical protein NNL38_09415 [Photobacterium atrarenae]
MAESVGKKQHRLLLVYSQTVGLDKIFTLLMRLVSLVFMRNVSNIVMRELTVGTIRSLLSREGISSGENDEGTYDVVASSEYDDKHPV